jgi:hypothetical protein
MGIIRSFAGVMKITLQSMKEDWDEMDKKFYRILFGAIGFIAMGLFWFYVVRQVVPF